MPDQVGVFNVPSFRDPYQGNVNVADPLGGGGGSPQADVNLTLPPWVNPIAYGHEPWHEPCRPGYYRPCKFCPCEIYEPWRPVDPQPPIDPDVGPTRNRPGPFTHEPGTGVRAPVVRQGGLDPLISGVAGQRTRGSVGQRDIFGTFQREGGGFGGGSQGTIEAYENPMITMGSPLLGENVISFDQGGKLTASEQKTLKKAAKKGRRGDTILAHINPGEAAMLKAMGGSGTINPYTGQEEYGWDGIGESLEFITSPFTTLYRTFKAAISPSYTWEDFAQDTADAFDPTGYTESAAERNTRLGLGGYGDESKIVDTIDPETGDMYSYNPETGEYMKKNVYGRMTSESGASGKYGIKLPPEQEIVERPPITGVEQKANQKVAKKDVQVVDPFSNLKDMGETQETEGSSKYRWDLENPLIRENVDIFRGGGKMNYYAGGGRNPYKYDNGGNADIPFSIAGKKFPAMMSTERDSFVHSSDLSDYGPTKSQWTDRMNNMMMQNTKQEIQNVIGKVMNTAAASMQLNNVANLGQKIKRKKFNQGGRF